MRNFPTLAAAAEFFARTAVEMDDIKRHCLQEGAELLAAEAKRAVDAYDANWTPSSPATSGADTPLFETGGLRDSIEHLVSEDAAYVGSNDEAAFSQEFGTDTIPPRPFLSVVAAAKQVELEELVASRVEAVMKKR
jgi:phage gpG-like protein